MTDSNNLLEVENLKTYFYNEDAVVKAVDGVSFQVEKGRSLGVVGESGCGKSVTAFSIINLLPSNKGKIVDGKVNYRKKNGEVVDIASLHPKKPMIRSIRGNEIAMVFQEPMTSINPVYTIGFQISESLRYHRDMDKKSARDRAVELLRLVGISAPDKRVDEYPHEMSGGMRQRSMIAIALSCDPNLLIADEPTTALDVTIEAQILELLEGLQERLGMSIMIITHDLGVIAEMADRVIVMYLGKVVEEGTLQHILGNPKHPYTNGLMNSIPEIGRKTKLNPIYGTVPSMDDLPTGCYFAPRCPQATDRCNDRMPEYSEIEPGHLVRCCMFE